MDIDLPFDFKQNLRNFLRKCSYSEFVDPYNQKTSYTKRFSRDYYPRFHLYINEKDGKFILNLHLDQKKPSYAGSHAHNAHYFGGIVEKDAPRIKGLIKNQLDNQSQEPKKEEKKGFFAKLFS